MDWRDIDRAVQILRAGGIVALPTETVYGLAADAANDAAVARIFEAKGRPKFNPLIVHVDRVDAARACADFDPRAERLAAAFWPGPLTLVLPRRADARLSLLVSAGLDTVALRAPAHPVAQAVLSRSGLALAAPSANRSGTVSPTTAEHVRAGLGDRVDFILDGGPCPVGLESTIVKTTAPGAMLLRPGGLAAEEIEAVLGEKLGRPAPGRIEAPGMTERHYAPAARLRLSASAPRADEAFLAFGPAPEAHPWTLNLSRSGDLVEAAANFFSHLRRLDALVREKNLVGIAAAPVPETGLGAAINDRLRRAAVRE